MGQILLTLPYNILYYIWRERSHANLYRGYCSWMCSDTPLADATANRLYRGCCPLVCCDVRRHRGTDWHCHATQCLCLCHHHHQVPSSWRRLAVVTLHAPDLEPVSLCLRISCPSILWCLCVSSLNGHVSSYCWHVFEWLNVRFLSL